MMQFTLKNYNTNPQTPIFLGKTPRQGLSQMTKSQPIVRSLEPVVETKVENKMTWGQPIWFLFHTLAQKVKKERFLEIKNELLKIIYTVCSFLPCPICANHAVEYMNKTNFNTIQKKEDLIKLLYDFHNEVNARKKLPIFDFDEAEKKYSSAITINILQNFMATFSNKSKSNKMITNEFHKTRFIVEFKNWFNKNINNFDA